MTRKDRFIVYCIVLHEMEEENSRKQWALKDNFFVRGKSVHAGFCLLFFLLFSTKRKEAITLFPELHKRSTTPGKPFLFRNWNERLAALREAIIETYY